MIMPIIITISILIIVALIIQQELKEHGYDLFKKDEEDNDDPT